MNNLNSENTEIEDQQSSTKGDKKDKPNISYIEFIQQTIKQPDAILTQDYKGYQQYGIINMSVFIGLIMLSSLVGRMMLYSGIEWATGDLFSYLSRGIAYAITIVIVIALFNWYANKEGKKFESTFFIEKLGALLIVPSILLAISIILELVDIRLYSWFSSMAFTFLYISVFIISYLMVAKNNLQVASVVVFGFYFVYRILYMIF